MRYIIVYYTHKHTVWVSSFYGFFIRGIRAVVKLPLSFLFSAICAYTTTAGKRKMYRRTIARKRTFVYICSAKHRRNIESILWQHSRLRSDKYVPMARAM